MKGCLTVRWSLYPVTPSDPSKATSVAEGTVVNASMLQCDVMLISLLTKEKAMSSWIFVKDQNFGDMRTKVRVLPSENKQIFDKLNNLW